MNKTLITKDAKGKIRVAEINCELLDSGIYLITRVKLVTAFDVIGSR